MKSYETRPEFVTLLCQFRDGSNSRLKEETLELVEGITYRVKGFITGYSNGKAELGSCTEWDFKNDGITFFFYESGEKPEIRAFGDDVYTVYYAIPESKANSDELADWIRETTHGTSCDCEECFIPYEDEDDSEILIES